MSGPVAPPERPSIPAIFRAFLAIGATSFGGGVVAYLRASLVGRHAWVDDNEFVELLSISQTLPGLNATNMAILVGDRLRGWRGAAAAIVGICLPGAVLMFVAGMLYGRHADRPHVDAMLRGVAAAAVGLVLATAVQLGRKSLSGASDLVFVLLTAGLVFVLKWSVLAALAAVGALAILWHRPRPVEGGGGAA